MMFRSARIPFVAAAFGLSLATVALSIAPAQAADSVAAQIERGAYLVLVGGCGDCHTPMRMGANGPEPDLSRRLSGHPAQVKMPPAPRLPAGPWLWIGSATNTAYAGPWGVSYSINLTPDPETGLGKWTEQQFVAALKNGRHLGASRPILPPMPWQTTAAMSVSDLRAIFAYLRTVTPIVNRVPDAQPAAAAQTAPRGMAGR